MDNFAVFAPHVVSDVSNGVNIQVVNAVFVAECGLYNAHDGKPNAELVRALKEFEKGGIPLYLYSRAIMTFTPPKIAQQEAQDAFAKACGSGIGFSKRFSFGFVQTYVNFVLKGFLGLVIEDSPKKDIFLNPVRHINPKTENLFDKMMQIKDLMLAKDFHTEITAAK